jgi:hypothetical protein
MARARINSSSKDLIDDNGAVLLSLIEGEQLHMDITLNWITNLSSHTLTAKIVEADMAGELDDEGLPKTVKTGGVVTTLFILDEITTDNIFKLVIPSTLSASWTTQPQPSAPSYGWIELEVKDGGLGSAQQIWKPFRGLVEVLFSPVDEV